MPQENNRVLNRIGARELTPQEVERVSGGHPTTTYILTSPPPYTSDCDGVDCGA